MKIFRRILLIAFLIVILIYVTNITQLPDSIILFKGESLNLFTVLGIFVKENENDYRAVQASSSLNSNMVETKTVSISLFNFIDVKDIEINEVPKTTVVPLGNVIGLKLYSSGVLVIGMTEIEGKKPYENSGIEEGDLIVEIDNKEICTTEELVECVNSSNGESLEITYIRGEKEYITTSLKVSIQKDKHFIIDSCSPIENVNSFLELSLAPTVLLFKEILDYNEIDINNRKNQLEKIFNNTKSYRIVSGFDYKDHFNEILDKI